MEENNKNTPLTQDFFLRSIAELTKVVKMGFDDVAKKFEEIDKRFEEIDKRFEEVNKKFDDIYQKLNDMNQEMAGVRSELTDIKNELTKVKRKLDILEKSSVEDIDAFAEDILFLRGKVKNLDKRIIILETAAV